MKKLIKNKKPKLIIEYSPKLYKENEDIKILEFLQNNKYTIKDIKSNTTIKDIKKYTKNFNKDQTMLYCE